MPLKEFTVDSGCQGSVSWEWRVEAKTAVIQGALGSILSSQQSLGSSFHVLLAVQKSEGVLETCTKDPESHQGQALCYRVKVPAKRI